MSDNVPGNSSPALPALMVDRLPLSSLTGQQITGLRASASASQDRFWSTPERAVGDATRDVVEVTFSTDRLVNYMSFATAHFPHTVRAEYYDGDVNAWLPLRIAVPQNDIAVDGRAEAFWTRLDDRVSAGPETQYVLADSIPSRVQPQSAIAYTHPQHFGTDHWAKVQWRMMAVQTSRVRLVLTRNPAGVPPTNQAGQPVAYSLGVKDWQVGYRVDSRSDVPLYGDPTTVDHDFASSNDLLGSRVVYSLRESSARNVTDGLDTTIWRSDPQPVNFAVVNFYADTRDVNGDGQVIDRFEIDPTTVGAHVNLYYSNDEPDDDFAASDDPLVYPIAQRHGRSGRPDQQPTRVSEHFIDFSEGYQSFVDIDNTYLQFDPRQPWWLGMAMQATADTTGVVYWMAEDDAIDHPWISFGQNVLRQNGGQIEFITEHGEVTSLPLPTGHLVGADFTIAVVWNPADTGDYPAGLSLVYRLGDAEDVVVTQAVAAFSARPATVSVGRYPDFGNPGNNGMRVRSMVLKTKAPMAAELDAFAGDAYSFVRKGDLPSQADASTDNAILRMSPAYSTPDTNPEGLVGGAGDRYASMVWTPLAQDYTLKKGFMFLPPTRARYWKFEFTNLVPEQYESFVPILRTTKVFKAQTVQAFQDVAGFGSWNPKYGGPGVRTALSLTEFARYSDAVDTLRQQAVADGGIHSATEGLVPGDLNQVQQGLGNGWIWTYQPWHVGSSAPRFVATQRHEYETVKVEHRTKVGFFAGLKTLRAYRVNYLADDDVAQYAEHFFDTTNVESTNGFEVGENHLTGLGYYAVATSKTFASHRPVRAVQFATTQTDSHQVLADDGFLADDLAAHWAVYGDAQLTRDPITREVTVNRGWYARSYALVEATPGYETYGALEGRLYGEIAGGQANGLAGGGIASEVYHPSSSGRVYAAAQITAQSTLSAPLLVQLVATEGNQVLAQTQVSLSAGETIKTWCGYTVGSATDPLTYASEEGSTYASLEAHTYGTFESRPISSDVFVRVMQVGETSDQFTVKRLSIFDDPIAWQFSVDGGTTWYDAMDVRNDPNGVLTFPTPGTQLRWRLRSFRPGAIVNSLAIRPWYGGLLGSIPANSGMHVHGPNRSVMDQFATIETDPMWQQWSSPVPRSWYDPPVLVEAQPVPEHPPVPLSPPRDEGQVVPTTFAVVSEVLPTVTDSASAVVVAGVGDVLDNFDRADFTPLAVATPSGLAWQQISGPGTVEIRSGKAQAVGGATRNRLDIGGPDQHFRITLQGYDTLAVGFRVLDASNRYEVQFNRTSWTLYRVSDGTPTMLASDSSDIAGHQGANYVYRIQVTGPVINVYRASALLLTYTDTAALSQGIGMDFLLGSDGDTADDLTRVTS